MFPHVLCICMWLYNSVKEHDKEYDKAKIELNIRENVNYVVIEMKWSIINKRKQ